MTWNVLSLYCLFKTIWSLPIHVEVVVEIIKKIEIKKI